MASNQEIRAFRPACLFGGMLMMRIGETAVSPSIKPISSGFLAASSRKYQELKAGMKYVYGSMSSSGRRGPRTAASR